MGRAREREFLREGRGSADMLRGGLSPGAPPPPQFCVWEDLRSGRWVDQIVWGPVGRLDFIHLQ